MQLAQDVVGDVACGARFAVQVHRDIGVAAADFGHETVQLAQGGVGTVRSVEFFVIDRQDETGRPALLLGESRQIAIAGVADDFHAMPLDGGGELADAGAAGVFGAEVLVNDDDGKAKAHA